MKAGAKFDVAVAEILARAEQRTRRRARPKDGKDKNARPPRTIAREADSDRPHVEISAPFNSSGDPITGVAPGQSVAQIAFRLEKDGDTPDDLVKLDDGYAVMQLKEKNPATKEQFENERETFVAAMLAAKQADALNGYIMRLKDGAKSETRISTRRTPALPRRRSRARARKSESEPPRGRATSSGESVTTTSSSPMGFGCWWCRGPRPTGRSSTMLFRVGSRFETRQEQRDLALSRAHALPRLAVAQDRARSGARLRRASGLRSTPRRRPTTGR